MPDQEYLELNRILIDFPLPYVAVRELHITEAADSHSILTLSEVSPSSCRWCTTSGSSSQRNTYRFWGNP